MSIKSQGQELFIGKDKITLISFLGNKYTIGYEELLNVEYKFPTLLQEGFIKFYAGSIPLCFYFTNKKCMAVQKGIDYLTEKEIVCEECDPLQKTPFYQSKWFIVLIMLFCCFPVGLFLMWRYHKFTLIIRIVFTILCSALFCKDVIEYINVMNSIGHLTDEIKNIGFAF